MRGKGDEFNVFRSINGITPAHAGKSAQIFRPCGEQWDHPRTCGEKDPANATLLVRAGSPPHMRGKVAIPAALRNVGGITPAHAGKSCTHGVICFFHGDHPRTCGEKSFRGGNTHANRGSPPHMRGKERRVIELTCAAGITPAHAGKSHGCGCCLDISGDHPRTCGEKIVFAITWEIALGSPPHMRGKAMASNSYDYNQGITPAHAGKRLRK